MRIRVRDLHLSFGKLDVLKGVNLDIEPGEVAVILGRSGTGKSVLLKLLLGLYRPDAGTIEIDGREITKLPESELFEIRRKFGVIFQSGGLLASLSVGENVGLGLIELTEENDERILDIVKEKLALVNLAGREMQDPSTLSGGQRKRAAVARALTMKSDCLLLDEPTAGLDPPMAATVDEIVEQVNREQKVTCVLVTHDLVSAFALGTKLHLLHEGKVVESGTPEQFKASQHPVVREFLDRDRKAPLRT